MNQIIDADKRDIILDGDKDVIIPQRYIPFDLGCSIDEEYKHKIKTYLEESDFKLLEIPGLLGCISTDAILKVEISTALKLYIFSYGIGVFVFEDNLYQIDNKYAVGYCDYRKQAHKEILEFKHGEISDQIKTIISELRTMGCSKKIHIRPSASETWESNGLSYVMTVSYILSKDNKRKDYGILMETDKKNLHIMLQPSIAHKEDTMAMLELEEKDQNFDPYNFEVENNDEPKNWIKSEDCAIYVSWAAVVVYLKNFRGKYTEIMECLEVDLQAMWFFTYCQYLNLRKCMESKKITSAQLKKEKYNFQRKYNEFIGDNDSSISVYIYEIRSELIKTSGINREKKNYIEYINYCIDETESCEGEKQRKYSVMNEVLLFIIAFIQIAPMLYSGMTGGYSNLKMWPIISMIFFVIVAVVFIIKKD